MSTGTLPSVHAPQPWLAIVVVSLSVAALISGPYIAGGLSGIDRTGPAGPPEITTCRIVEVIDGDTVGMDCAGMPFRARLTGFDTPELFSPGCPAERAAALRAKQHLSALVSGGAPLGVTRHGQDRYGRTLVTLTVGGKPVASKMIAAGLARPYDGGRRGGWCAEMTEAAT